MNSRSTRAGARVTSGQLFAQAMLGQLKKSELVTEIKDKRKQDSVRALGLLPLEEKAAKKDVLERYSLLQEFVRHEPRVRLAAPDF